MNPEDGAITFLGNAGTHKQKAGRHDQPEERDIDTAVRTSQISRLLARTKCAVYTPTQKIHGVAGSTDLSNIST